MQLLLQLCLPVLKRRAHTGSIEHIVQTLRQRKVRFEYRKSTLITKACRALIIV